MNDARLARLDGALVAAAAKLIDGVRRRRPEIHALTSPVAQVLTANAALAIGAEPSLSIGPGEAQAMAERADAGLINVGMLDEERKAAMEDCAAIFARRQIPWVLDPVKIERSPPRMAFCQDLVDENPSILRCNQSEAAVLDIDAIVSLGVVAAITGATDDLRSHDMRVSISAGHPLMARTTAIGCASGAVLAAFAATAPDEPFMAAAAALMAVGVAGERAAAKAGGPGTFPALFIDSLAELDGAAIADRSSH